MTCTIVSLNELPNGSVWTRDCRLFIQHGYVSAWGCQQAYGKQIIASRYVTPDNKELYVEKYVEKITTQADAVEALRNAGYCGGC